MKTKVYETYPAEGSPESEGIPGVCLSQNAYHDYIELYDVSSPGMSIFYARSLYPQLSQKHDPSLVLIPYSSGLGIILPRLQWVTILSSMRNTYNLPSSQAQTFFRLIL
jgi:hypothetical protein